MDEAAVPAEDATDTTDTKDESVRNDTVIDDEDIPTVDADETVTNADKEVNDAKDGDKEEKAKSKQAASSIEFKGKEFDVKIDCDPDAGLPADTELDVSEITAKDKEYKDYYKKAIEAAVVRSLQLPE